MTGRSVRIACSSAFWGDTPTAAPQLVHKGERIDYLVSDYLAEITMCILARMKEKARGGAGEGGFVEEYVHTVWKPLMKEIMAKKIKLVTNAGVALKKAIEQVARESGVEVPIVAVTGDDLMEKSDSLSSLLRPFGLLGEEESLPPPSAVVMSCNAYLGAVPIAAALREGAQIVVTGRCVDSALVLGPLVYEFGWSWDSWDCLSGGSLAGHLIECGCQATGGNFTDWHLSQANGWHDNGFPIAECFADGSCVISKPDGTGGLVSVGTVGEQLLYEIGDPGAYLLPDVSCDWRHVTLTELPPSPMGPKGRPSGRVLVKGAKGRPPPSTAKVALTTFDGWRISGWLAIAGNDAGPKAEAVGKALLRRCSDLLKSKGMDDFSATSIELLGTEQGKLKNSREVVLRLAAAHSDKRAVGLLGREVASAATGMAPGLFGGDSGRPQPTPRIRYSSALFPSSLLRPTLWLGDRDPQVIPWEDRSQGSERIEEEKEDRVELEEQKLSGKVVNVPLSVLAYGRSGDKGDTCNIGVMARTPSFYPLLHKYLTEERVKTYMSHFLKGKVKRCVGDLGTLTLALGGGGVSSLQVDRQGKAYAQILLTLEIAVPVEYLPPSVTSKL